MSTGQPAWILLALLGGAAGVALFAVLRVSLMSRFNPRSKKDAWERGRLPLVGFTLSLLALGAGMGGAVATWPRSVDGWWGSLIQFGPEPLADVPSASPTADQERPSWYSMHPPAPTGTPDLLPESPQDTPPPPTDGQDPDPDTDAATPHEIPAPYGVRVGVFRRTDNVDGLVAELRRSGYAPLVVGREDAAGAAVYYVYAGAYATRAEAADVAREIRARGADAMVVEIGPTGSGS